MTRRFNTLMVAFILLVGLPFYWLFLENSPGDTVAKPVEIADLRRLASSMPGPAPTEIRYEVVGRETRSANALSAGSGLRGIKRYFMAHMLLIPDGEPILIGSGATRRTAKMLDWDTYDSSAQRQVNRAMRGDARVILLNSRAPQSSGQERLSLESGGALGTRLIGAATGPVEGSEPYAVAPGVVVIPTSDRLEGTRLVYARLQNGKEFLFAGGLSPTKLNWREIRAASRLVTDFLRDENRAETYSWLRTVRKWKRQAPDLNVVSGNKVPKDKGLKRYFPSQSEE